MKKDLTRKQFDLLAALAEAEGPLTQRALQERTGHSLGIVNRTMKELKEKGFADGGVILAKGREALEPYTAKRAVFIAAGFGSRLAPITLNTPKPLVRVHGKRIIDGLIDACLKAGVTEIYIVRGYLAEQFDQLLYKYPMIRFLENPFFNEANNISSALAAKDLLKNAYVFEADLLLSNPDVIKRYHYTSDFLAIKKDHCRGEGRRTGLLADGRHFLLGRGGRKETGKRHSGGLRFPGRKGTLLGAGPARVPQTELRGGGARVLRRGHR